MTSHLYKSYRELNYNTDNIIASELGINAPFLAIIKILFYI